jgi:hypothetical protein
MSATPTTRKRTSVVRRSPADVRPARHVANHQELAQLEYRPHERACRRASRLTLDMSGDWKLAKQAGRRPLDGRVRRLVEQSLGAGYKCEFATPDLCQTGCCEPQRTVQPARPDTGSNNAQACCDGALLTAGGAA